MTEDGQKQPLISVIVPVYNVKGYLERCLQSICAQTYKNLEIIVIDDGSSDGSGELCDAFALKDRRMRVVHQDNAGQSVARNRGLALAQGQLLGFVDADDWIEADMYESLFRMMTEQEADISVCSHDRHQADTRAKYTSGKVSVLTRNEAIRALVVDKRVRNYVWDKLYKRCLFDGVRFPPGRIFEDIAVSYRLFYGAQKIAVQETPKYHYVIREGSSMQSKYDARKEYCLFQAVYEQVRFVLDKGIWDDAAVYVVRRGIRLIDHASMLPPSSSTDEIIKEVLAKMHEFDEVSCFRLGLSLSVKRFFIFRFLKAYRRTYRFVRSVCQSRRHRF